MPAVIIGYARVSSDDQNIDLQPNALTQAGCTRLSDDRSGRPQGGADGFRTCPGGVTQRQSSRRMTARPARPLNVGSVSPTGSWPLLMIGFGPVSQPRSEAS